ncbi:hypothetical protein R3Q06_27765 [Rhodococcus erythropolis]|uniref:hypothetical protein n=1 Tax=Rhodococcus erythropolis TaxID=1833 RepID=UPI00294938D0|nr:hypothetical protein [Rhodococcus erythropolis]MDV6277298.1 hypothetical protein [Rhodococcus erythropolis]
MRRFIQRLAIPVAAVTAAGGLLILGTPATADEAPPTSFTGTTDNLIFTKSVIGNAAVTQATPSRTKPRSSTTKAASNGRSQRSVTSRR